MRRALPLLALLAACGERQPTEAVAVGPARTSAEVIGSGEGASPPAAAVAPASAELVSPGPAATPPRIPGAQPAPTASGPAFALPMRLVGTEPFWGGRIARDAITISGMDRPDARFPYTDPVVTGAGARWRTQSTGAFPLTVTLVRDPCSDGMSDKRYPFQATVVLGTETLKGCAILEKDFGGER